VSVARSDANTGNTCRASLARFTASVLRTAAFTLAPGSPSAGAVRKGWPLPDGRGSEWLAAFPTRRERGSEWPAAFPGRRERGSEWGPHSECVPLPDGRGSEWGSGC
jgi:hypothetical protein